MPGLEIEDVYETDSSDNEENHSKLLSSVSQLDSTQRIKPAQRKEIASEVSEYNLNKGLPTGKNLIDVRELVKVLGKKPEHEIISSKIKKVSEKSRVLPKPLEKPAEERIKRAIGFGKVKKELRKWDAIVTRNALKDQITFPLNDKSMSTGKSDDFLSQFKSQTSLEKELAKVLNEEKKEERNSDDEKFPLSLDEMMEKRKEMAQLRARLSYNQSKAKRQSKIKSKKYHRLLKREKVKQQLKEFELLQKTDPEAALKKLEELDKTRAKERASLRHRNTGKWAKNLKVRAKYDIETRKVLAEQLKMSRELTQKVSQLESSEDEEADNSVPPEKLVPTQIKSSKPTVDNPWMLDVSKEVQDFVSDYKKFWSEKGEEISQNESKEKEKQSTEKNESANLEVLSKGTLLKSENIQKTEKTQKHPAEVKSSKKKKVSSKNISSKKKISCETVKSSSGVWLVTPVTDEPNSKIKTKRKAEDINILFDELQDNLLSKATKKVRKIQKNLKMKEKKENKKKSLKKNKSNMEFDLSFKNSHVIERPDSNDGLLENGVETEDVELVSRTVPLSSSGLDNTENEVPPLIDPKNFIQVKAKKLNTFLPDNITGEEDELDNEKAQQMTIEEAFQDDDVMAEFNDMKKKEEEKNKVEIETSLPGWGQWGGTGIVPNKRKKRLLILNLPRRKDKLKKDVIINENENPNLKNHLVKEVPHPFKSVDAFEANIRAPVCRDWVPETAHQKLIQKEVVTKLGAVIEPMTEDEIVNLKKAAKSPYQGKKKKEKTNLKN